METRRYTPVPESTSSRPRINGRLLQAGDEQAWADFISYSRPLFMRIAYQSGSTTPEEANDVCQDALLKLFEAREKIDFSNPQAYVARCIVNRNIDHGRRKKRIRFLPIDSMPTPYETDELEPNRINLLEDPDPTPEETALLWETQDEVNSTIQALSPVDQRALTQQFMYEMGPIEASEINGTTRSCEKSKFYRAREAFRTAFTAQNQLPLPNTMDIEIDISNFDEPSGNLDNE